MLLACPFECLVCVRARSQMVLPMAGLVWDVCAGPRTSLVCAYIRYRPDMYLIGGGDLNGDAASSQNNTSVGAIDVYSVGDVSQIHRLTDISKVRLGRFVCVAPAKPKL